MTWNMDDPRWTAYALGELPDADRNELDRILEASADARAYVASLRDAATLIETELRGQPTLALDELQRRRIHNAAVAPPRRRWRLALGGVATTAAAGLALMVFTTTRVSDTKPSAQSMHERRIDVSKLESEGKALALATKQQQRLKGISGDFEFRGMPLAGAHRDVDLPQHGTEGYARIDDNPFRRVAQEPLSTFSIDVDTASYANIRRFLDGGQRPPKDAVRIEEMINYFRYRYPPPAGNEPFSVTTEVGPAPWNASHQLVRVGVQTAAIPDAQVPARNLTFLIDTSGSMQAANKLTLLKQSLGMLVENLRPQDQVAIVVYAGSAGLVLAPTSDRAAILDALDRLEAGGSTNGGAGIQLAYDIAQAHLVQRGINRVILCSDGDMNVGITSEGDLTRLIEKERDRGVFLTVLGFGMGNLKDSNMEKLADRGNGNYAYIDSLFEARKVLVKEAGATLVTVAKDVKLQVEFNPAAIAGYRLIGYENRVLANQDFNDDKKDAGEIGAGHAVTAIYEVVPAGVEVPSAKVDDLKYQRAPTPAASEGELLTVKIRYKAPDGDTSKLLSRTVQAGSASRELAATSTDYRWVAAIAGFGMLLRDSPYRGTLSWPQVQSLAEGALGDDTEGYRKQALALITKASKLPATEP